MSTSYQIQLSKGHHYPKPDISNVLVFYGRGIQETIDAGTRKSVLGHQFLYPDASNLLTL